jgi:hypothetical protein
MAIDKIQDINKKLSAVRDRIDAARDRALAAGLRYDADPEYASLVATEKALQAEKRAACGPVEKHADTRPTCMVESVMYRLESAEVGDDDGISRKEWRAVGVRGNFPESISTPGNRVPTFEDIKEVTNA